MNTAAFNEKLIIIIYRPLTAREGKQATLMPCTLNISEPRKINLLREKMGQSIVDGKAKLIQLKSTLQRREDQ